ncbi:MAG: hypothetical protein K2O18_02155 [Oscillospiraceae bacterium]|nr:hypothetical protein [Oscillospiraceae bacterium]
MGIANNPSDAISPAMQEARNLWWQMYVNRPPWADCEVRPLGLPGALGRELARHVLSEFSVRVSGGERARFLNDQLREAGKNFCRCLELGLCLGGIALRPYLDHGRLFVDISAVNFLPTRFDGTGKAVGGLFKSNPVREGNRFFVRLESHDFISRPGGEQVYVIRNRAFVSNIDGCIGSEVPLSEVSAWKDLEPETCIQDLTHPLFAYFKPPVSNDIDPESQLGVSVYGGAAAELIRQADEQWKLLRWEYASGKRRVYVDGISEEQFDDDIFVAGPFSSDGNFFQVFSPDFRDDPLYNGFQRILQRIEFQTGLAYGTISDPQSVEKTATEIIAAKHRQYVTEKGIQKAFQSALDGLLFAMDAWCDLAGLAPHGPFQTQYHWGDGVLDDPETRRLDMSLDAELVEKGLLLPWEFRMKWFDEEEAAAKALINQSIGKESSYES